MKTLLLFLLATCILLQGCSKRSVSGIFTKRTPSDKYADKLIENGLNTSNMGRLWLSANAGSFAKAQSIGLPYRETGYFSADRPAAHAYAFSARRGEKITITLQQKPREHFNIYVDVYENNGANQPGNLAATLDTLSNTATFEVEKVVNFLLRIQPELLAGGEYTLTVSNGASLSFPVQGKTKAQSFWGDGRDNDSRKHEGVDILANRGTPAIAAANGTVTRVGTNNLGGNIVFMRPAGRDYTLYYAHLDKQLVIDGQNVSVGDTLGLVGNTGNAISTVPHLHFGIYTPSGAVDPYPFIAINATTPPAVAGNLAYLGDTLRTSQATRVYSSASGSVVINTLAKNTILNIEAATGGFFRVVLPDNSTGYVDRKSITSLATITSIKAEQEIAIFDQPSMLAARKTTAKPGQTISILGSYGVFNYVSTNGIAGWASK